MLIIISMACWFVFTLIDRKACGSFKPSLENPKGDLFIDLLSLL